MPSGSGHARPAVCARFTVSRTVERARPNRRAISCVDTDAAFSRKTSRASRMFVRSAGIGCSLGLPKGRPDQANGGARQGGHDPGRDHSVMGGEIISESGGGIIPLRGARSSRNGGPLRQESALDPIEQKRRSYGLARLAAKFGPEIALRDLTDRFSYDCMW